MKVWAAAPEGCGWGGNHRVCVSLGWWTRAGPPSQPASVPALCHPLEPALLPGCHMRLLWDSNSTSSGVTHRSLLEIPRGAAVELQKHWLGLCPMRPLRGPHGLRAFCSTHSPHQLHLLPWLGGRNPPHFKAFITWHFFWESISVIKRLFNNFQLLHTHELNSWRAAQSTVSGSLFTVQLIQGTVGRKMQTKHLWMAG